MADAHTRQQIPTDDNEIGWCPNRCKVYVGFQRQQRMMIHPVCGWVETIEALRADDPTASSVAMFMETWACHVCKRTITVFEQRALMPGKEPAEAAQEIVLHRALAYPKPSPRALDPGIPEEIRSVYTEASKAEQAGALRAAAVMYRAAVEEMCRDKQAPGTNLKQQIEGLGQSGVSADLVADLDEARLLGNWSIHQGVAFAADEVADVASLIEEALFQIYVQPAQRQAMRAARQARRDANPRR